jgi:hypothetical protein
MAGYSKRSLAHKLGVKIGFRVAVVNPPENYFNLLLPLPPSVLVLQKPGKGMDLIHFFTGSRMRYERKLIELKKLLVPNGMLWISWPKAASKVPTDMSDKIVRNFALRNGLVDIKVCAVDETWSGLKLVIPLKDRKGKST